MKSFLHLAGFPEAIVPNKPELGTLEDDETYEYQLKKSLYGGYNLQKEFLTRRQAHPDLGRIEELGM